MESVFNPILERTAGSSRLGVFILKLCADWDEQKLKCKQELGLQINKCFYGI